MCECVRFFFSKFILGFSNSDHLKIVGIGLINHNSNKLEGVWKDHLMAAEFAGTFE